VVILGKAEWFNPGGSVKDRAAWSIVSQGLEHGWLPGRRLLDASSGNTGVAYAMLGAAVGFGVTICIPASASSERLGILEAYGAELVVTDPLEGTDGSIREAVAMAEREEGRFWYADQYGNDANWRAHYAGTGPEIWEKTRGTVTHFIVGVGTSGTLVGAGRRLKELDPGIRVISVEPSEPLHAIEGLKHLETATRPGIYDPSVADERTFVGTEEAQLQAARLARESGCFVGASSGAAYAAALRVASGIEAGTLVVMLPDGGDRYLSLERPSR
jgi:cysteine synthase B